MKTSLTNKYILTASFVMCLSVGGLVMTMRANPTYAQTTEPSTSLPADNTGINVRDRSTLEPTADQASNRMSDVAIMKRIRKDIIADKSLSSYAHNIKIIAKNGMVTLKGPVRSEEEKQNIQIKVVNIIGDSNYVNHLTIKHKKTVH